MLSIKLLVFVLGFRTVMVPQPLQILSLIGIIESRII